MVRSPVILNVNDTDATRYLMTKILQKGGYEVHEAVSGAEALRIAEQAPDLIILDVHLPDVSGLEVCRRLKAEPRTATIPILQTSATFMSSARKVEGLDSGADAYLAQPIEALELLAMVRAMLRTQRAERAEQLAARKWQRTFDAIRDAVLIVDKAAVISECNQSAARLFGRSPKDIVGRRLQDVLGDLPADEVQALLDSSNQGRSGHEVEHDRRWFWVTSDPVSIEAGTPDHAVITFNDITDRKQLEDEHRTRAEQQAEDSTRKDEFLAMLAHELRNPLNAISASVAIQERTGAQDDNSVRLRSIIKRQTRNLARMVDDLLDLSRITRGQIQLRRKRIDVLEVVRQAVLGSQPAFDVRRISLHTELPDEPLPVYGDSLRLEQVVMNLLSNAAKYSEPQSTVKLLVSASGDRARICVSDTGIGIPEDKLKPIFEPFVQLDQSLARSLGGLGIGLTIVRRIVELHGGSVSAQSAGIGRGAEFAVHLPLTTSVDRFDTEPPSARTSATEPNVLSVLIVDDNLDTLELLQALLEMKGHSVHAAADGRAGLGMALSMQPDLALIDIGLPGMNGYELAKALREARKPTFLVAVTGYGRPEDRARALDCGFDAFLVKPIDAKALDQLLALPFPSV